MSLPYSTSRAVFLGNDVTTRFPFSFTVWQNVELAVTVTDPAGNSNLVQGWQVELSPTGGTLVYEHNHAPLPTGYSLAITRAMPFTQEIDLVSGTRFDAEAIETALDKATAERQQLREALSRAVKLPETSLDTPENLVQNLYTARNEAQAAADNAQTSENNAAASATLAANTVAAGLVSVEAARAGAVADVQAEGAVHIAAATAQAAAAASSADTALAQAAAAATSASTAQAWAESTTNPDPNDTTSKSAKSWAEQAGADVTATIARVETAGTEQVNAINALVTETPAPFSIPKTGAGKTLDQWVSIMGKVIGEAFISTGTDVPAGALPADGTQYTGFNVTYPDAYTWVTTKAKTKTLTEYTAIVNQHGECGFWGLDTATGTVRVPMIKSFIQGTTSVENRWFVQIYSSVLPASTADMANWNTQLDGRANTTLSNLTQEGTTKVAHLAMPGARVINLQASDAATAAVADGYLYICAWYPGGLSWIRAIVDGRIFQTSFSTQSNTDYISLFIPIRKSQLYLTEKFNCAWKLIEFVYAEGAY